MFKKRSFKNTIQFFKFSQFINKYIWICTILAALLTFVGYCYFGLYLLEIENILDYERLRPTPVLEYFVATVPAFAFMASLKVSAFLLALGYVLNIIIFKHQKFNLIFILSIIILAKGLVDYSQQAVHAIDIWKTKIAIHRIDNFKYPNEIQKFFIDYQKKPSKKYQKEVLYAITLNPNTSSQTLNDISKINNSEFYELLTETKDYFFDNRKMLRRSTVMNGVASHPHALLSTLERLSINKSTNLYLLQDIVENPNVSKELIYQISEKYGDDIDESIAQSTRTPPEYLEKLASKYKNDRNASWIKLKLCRNPNTTIHALELISHDGDVKTLHALIQIKITVDMVIAPDLMIVLYFYNYDQYKITYGLELPPLNRST